MLGLFHAKHQRLPEVVCRVSYNSNSSILTALDASEIDVGVLYRRKESLITLSLPERFEREIVVVTRKHRKLPQHIERFVENILF